jgi:hypothetical protein
MNEPSEMALQLQDQPAEVWFPRSLGELLEFGAALVKSKALPKAVDSPEAAAAIMLTSRELGIPIMQGFRGIFIVDGKTALSAQLMAALLIKSGHKYRVIEQTNKGCKIKFLRRGDTEWQSYEFTQADAAIAGLLGKANWQNYPKSMYFSRAMTGGCHTYFPDVLSGLYPPEELDADVVDVPLIEEKSTAPVGDQWTLYPSFIEQFRTWCAKEQAKRGVVYPTETIDNVALGVPNVVEYLGTPAQAKEAVIAFLDKAGSAGTPVDATNIPIDTTEGDQ